MAVAVTFKSLITRPVFPSSLEFCLHVKCKGHGDVQRKLGRGQGPCRKFWQQEHPIPEQEDATTTQEGQQDAYSLRQCA